MLTILRDLLRYNREFAAGAVLMAFVLIISCLSFFSPYPPQDIYRGAARRAAVLGLPARHHLARPGHVLATDLRDPQHAPVRLHGRAASAASSRSIIGLLSGYLGGTVDRVLMSINDTFIVIPLFPILVLFYFVMRDSMTWALLALVMACLGWAYDARLIRSITMSLRTREFTESGIFSGMTTRQIVTQEHLPYVLPIMFSTTMNNINWSIGLEVTLSVLGFTNINTPTIGVMIYWANQHTALVAGIWWWIFFPVALVVITFIGLFLLAVSMNEYIDPRSRLSRMGGAPS